MNLSTTKKIIAGAAMVLAVVLAFNLFGGPDYAGQMESDDRAKRLAAVAGLEQMDDEYAVKVLTRYIADTDIEVARRVLVALGRMRKSAAIADIKPALDDSRKELREAAVIAIGSRGLAGDPSLVRDKLKSDPESSVRMAAASVLGEMRDWDSMETFAAMLTSGDEELQTVAGVQMLRIAGIDHQGFRPGADPRLRQSAVQFLRVNWRHFKGTHEQYLRDKEITGR
jgi:HEAT repeat protein